MGNLQGDCCAIAAGAQSVGVRLSHSGIHNETHQPSSVSQQLQLLQHSQGASTAGMRRLGPGKSEAKQQQADIQPQPLVSDPLTSSSPSVDGPGLKAASEMGPATAHADRSAVSQLQNAQAVPHSHAALVVPAATHAAVQSGRSFQNDLQWPQHSNLQGTASAHCSALKASHLCSHEQLTPRTMN